MLSFPNTSVKRGEDTMRGWRFYAIAVFLILTIVAVTASNAGSASQQQVQVTKGDLVIKINGSGKIGVDTDAQPSFGAGGKISKLYVKEGDTVTKGMVLAKLETDALELALSQAQLGLAQAKVAFAQVQTAQIQANISLTGAQFNLDRTKAVSDIMDEISSAQLELKVAQMQYQEARIYSDSDRIAYWLPKIAQLEIAVLEKQQKLADLLSKEEFTGEFLYILGQKYDRLLVEDARIKKLQVDLAQQTVTQADLSVEQAKRAVDQATKAIALAQKQLDDATIVSPINGLAVTVNVKEGDVVVPTGLSVPIYLVDPATMRISSQIDEIDIAGVKIGQKVNIKLDSSAETIYEGKVNSISLSPVLNPQNSGVVVYEVKVGFVNPTPPEVKLGMSATVDIISIERPGAILVPSRAVKTNDKGQTVVDVMVDQKIESRQIQTGISDGINTEVLSGLKVGDIVIVTRAATTLGMFGQ
jgi:HlyD family secretion protein